MDTQTELKLLRERRAAQIASEKLSEDLKAIASHVRSGQQLIARHIAALDEDIASSDEIMPGMTAADNMPPGLAKLLAFPCIDNIPAERGL